MDLQTSSLCVVAAWTIFLCPVGDCPSWEMRQRSVNTRGESIQLLYSPNQLRISPELDHGGTVRKARMKQESTSPEKQPFQLR